MTGPETDMRNSSPTEEDVLNALRSGPESTESSSEPFHQSVEDQRFIDRIRTDRTRQLALGTQRAPIDKRAPRIELEVNFEFNSATIGRKAEPQLISLGSALTSSELKGKAFLIAGYSDAAGDDQFSQALSERRAVAVKRFLTEKFGIPPDSLTTVGYGKERLKNPAEPLSAENRRIEIVNLSDLAALCRRGPSSAPYC
jgi:outer membrane protein OmpA-like peptidoglycan-associated protein